VWFLFVCEVLRLLCVLASNRLCLGVEKLALHHVSLYETESRGWWPQASTPLTRSHSSIHSLYLHDGSATSGRFEEKFAENGKKAGNEIGSCNLLKGTIPQQVYDQHLIKISTLKVKISTFEVRTSTFYVRKSTLYESERDEVFRSIFTEKRKRKGTRREAELTGRLAPRDLAFVPIESTAPISNHREIRTGFGERTGIAKTQRLLHRGKP
jgi:hypothetical protein